MSKNERIAAYYAEMRKPAATPEQLEEAERLRAEKRLNARHPGFVGLTVKEFDDRMDAVRVEAVAELREAARVAELAELEELEAADLAEQAAIAAEKRRREQRRRRIAELQS